MFKLSALVVLVAAIACSVAEAKPAVVVGAAVPAGVVTATSSQYVARNFNGVAAAPIVAPVAAAYTAPVAAAYSAPVAAAYSAPVAAAYTAPVAAAYSAPVAAAYTAPVAAAYSAYPYASYPYAAGYTTVL
ncbi:GL17843 [Drosophila persimilis]|uniref:GL17843 n=1 Tax=Drosophila persimilis TaxID=7234 RepID=B4H270_DROPE|nr:vitelline membrane protein Vm26Ab [Drosophila persimilis]EDW30422.1 GL17843 [Drosophila persimilis]